MKVLVINCGSSSLKYQVLDMTNETLLAKGLVERIGMETAVITHEKDSEKFKKELPIDTHKVAIGLVLDAILDKEHGVVADLSEIGAVGHRVAHGGEKNDKSALIDDTLLKSIEECVELAPLHNPANLLGINACRELMPNTPMVAAFDTAFHQTMPEESFIYALPYEYYEKYRVRRYGFHGTSHKYVSLRAAKMLGKSVEELKIVTCHLGNGASVAAIKNGKCIDTSMGFTPLEGLVMGTRCGDIDPAIVTYIAEKEGLDNNGINDVLNKKSGVFGISGVSSDFRDLEDAAEQGNKRAQLAIDAFAHRVKRYIGAYIAELNGADAIVFTAGIGENDKAMREKICDGLDNLDIKLDVAKNDIRGEEKVISTDDSKVEILLIPTDEELMIARDTLKLASNK